MNRITNTDKWKDEWFISLHPYAKLIFIFLYENCDEAGFYKPKTSHMKKYIGMSAKDIVLYTKTLEEKIVFNESRQKVWIKNFLFYQDQLPLEKKNPEHQKIMLIIEKNLKDFNNHEDLLFILEKTSNTTTKKVKRFVKPTIEEIKKYAIEYSIQENIEISEDWAKGFYNHNASKGWKVGKNPMKDWQAAVRTWLGREKKNKTVEQPKGKIAQVIKANEGITDVNVD